MPFKGFRESDNTSNHLSKNQTWGQWFLYLLRLLLPTRRCVSVRAGEDQWHNEVLQDKREIERDLNNYTMISVPKRRFMMWHLTMFKAPRPEMMTLWTWSTITWLTSSILRWKKKIKYKCFHKPMWSFEKLIRQYTRLIAASIWSRQGSISDFISEPSP